MASTKVYAVMSSVIKRRGRPNLGSTTVTPDPPATGVSAYEWSDSKLPWAYTDTDVFTADWPSNTTIVDISTASTDFWTNLNTTVNAASGRIVIRLQEGVYSLKSFRMIGASGDPTYAFGFWFPKLQGFLGQGPDKTFVQMDANSMSQAQLDKMATMKAADFAPNALGFARFDGSSSASPILIAGVTFRAADQQILGTTSGDVYGATAQQSAPHNGLVLYANAYYNISYTRFQAAGKAMTAAPPFEHANVGSQYSPSGKFKNCEFDGRRSEEFDSARTRACGPVMLNNEALSELTDCWLHHSNLSRYAANDENRATQGIYRCVRTKIEQISNTNNDGRGGSGSQASCMGWESVSGTIELTDCIISQDNTRTSGSIPHHISLTSTGSRNPQGGRLFVQGGEFRNVFSSVNGFFCVRAISTTYWVLDGVANTLSVKNSAGVAKTPYQVPSGAWPPTAASLAAAGVTKETHFLVRG